MCNSQSNNTSIHIQKNFFPRREEKNSSRSRSGLNTCAYLINFIQAGKDTAADDADIAKFKNDKPETTTAT